MTNPSPEAIIWTLAWLALLGVSWGMGRRRFGEWRATTHPKDRLAACGEFVNWATLAAVSFSCIGAGLVDSFLSPPEPAEVRVWQDLLVLLVVLSIPAAFLVSVVIQSLLYVKRRSMPEDESLYDARIAHLTEMAEEQRDTGAEDRRLAGVDQEGGRIHRKLDERNRAADEQIRKEQREEIEASQQERERRQQEREKEGE